jgi:uncharacterized membrane protein (DUF106 family)
VKTAEEKMKEMQEKMKAIDEKMKEKEEGVEKLEDRVQLKIKEEINRAYSEPLFSLNFLFRQVGIVGSSTMKNLIKSRHEE